MAGYLGFLTGLIDVTSLSRVTNIPTSTLYKYAAGDYRPSAARLDALKTVYSKIQTTRLQIAGLPFKEAKRFSILSKANVNKTINQIETVISHLAQKNRIGEDVIRRNMAKSDQTAEELFGSGTEA